MRLRFGGKPDGQRIELDLHVAATWLLDHEEGKGYPRASVRLYDYADTDDLDDARRCSPRDHVSLTDLGRITCLGASLRYNRAHDLMTRTAEFNWPSSLPRLRDTPDDETFIVDPGVEAAEELFRQFKRLPDIATGTASKLLHLKWPDFYPIADRQFRRAYGRRAASLHNASRNLEGTRQRSDGEIRAYWLAFRVDLADNHDALAALPDRIREIASTEEDRVHAERLAALGPLRLLDMLAWGHSDGP